MSGICEGAPRTKKRVAIIGAGCSGLTSVKSCLDEGLDPVCFERDDDLGGLWKYNEATDPDKGSIYKSCVINTSKETVAFSDFPVPPHYPPFMPHDYVLQYFRDYAQHFDLEKHIQYGVSVDCIEPTEEHDNTGQWYVVTRRSEDDQAASCREVFDAVMICSGHHVYPYKPSFEGLEYFNGTVIHSHQYKVPEPFREKEVLVIGIGNSAVDIAVDISTIAKKVYLSTRRGAWIVSRMGPIGLPADAVANSRLMFTLPRPCLQKMVEIIANFRFDHTAYGVKPKHRALEAHPTINDELPYRIMTGKVQVRSNVSHFTQDGVVLEDESYQHVDCVILATGYDYKFKFLEPTILEVDNNAVELYKYVFPPKRKHQTLAVIGFIQAIGSVMPIAEMQARWVTRVFSGSCLLPDETVMLQDIAVKKDRMNVQYLPSRRHTLETFWIEYMDEVADHIGVRPRLWSLFLRDPFLAIRCFVGPCTAAQYRLQGPGKWDRAADCIRKVLTNYEHGTKHRQVSAQNNVTGTPRHVRILRHMHGLVLVLLFIYIMTFLYQFFVIC